MVGQGTVPDIGNEHGRKIILFWSTKSPNVVVVGTRWNRWKPQSVAFSHVKYFPSLMSFGLIIWTFLHHNSILWDNNQNYVHSYKVSDFKNWTGLTNLWRLWPCHVGVFVQALIPGNLAWVRWTGDCSAVNHPPTHCRNDKSDLEPTRIEKIEIIDLFRFSDL